MKLKLSLRKDRWRKNLHLGGTISLHQTGAVILSQVTSLGGMPLITAAATTVLKGSHCTLTLTHTRAHSSFFITSQ